MQDKLAQKFGMLLKEKLIEKKIRQISLAEYLGVTPSAVCQVLRGKIVPSGDKFRRMMEFIGTDPESGAELESIWIRLRSGETYESSMQNRQLRALRVRKNFSLPALAAASGIDPRRLRELETLPDARLTEQEAAHLAAVLGEDPLASRERVYAPHVTPALEAADAGSANFTGGSKVRLPMLYLSDLGEYTPGELMQLAAARGRFFRSSASPLAVDAVLVRANGAMLNWNWPGQVDLLVTEHRPRGLFDLLLGRDRRGGFHLVCPEPRTDRKEAERILSGYHGQLSWRLAVLQCTLLPMYFIGDVENE